MRELIVFRHAKSSWDHPELEDIDRPLNRRGERNAPEMGKRLREEDRVPERLCCSPALRARATAVLLAEALGMKRQEIVVIEDLYPGTPADWLAVTRHLDERDKRVLLIGHNPGLTDFVNSLADSDIDNVPTAAYAAINFDAAGWRDVAWGTGNLARFDYPKSRKAR